ncbi:MAG: DUF2783 domain-containing protein [Hydrogenophaga sp.]|nr:DUF2783 domain-containing protein [Hydrogenophaga sp.]
MENFYDAMADHIDRATPEKSRLFLAKLALQLASEVKDPEKLRHALEVALLDL